MASRSVRIDIFVIRCTVDTTVFKTLGTSLNKEYDVSPSRPKLISLPPDPDRRRQLETKLQDCLRQLPGGTVSSFADVGLACWVVLLTMVLDYRRIDTDRVYEAMIESNPDLAPILEVEPLLFNGPCWNISAFCQGRGRLSEGR